MAVTPNLQLNLPVFNSPNWDVPTNASMSLIDSALGAVSNVALSNIPVVLAAAQYQCGFINFTGTLTGNVTVTFPAYGRIYWLQNSCVSNTAFSVICKTAASASYVALPPGEAIAVMCDGTDMKFVGLGRVGTYWDFAGTTVPLWVSATVPAPYLNCDGTAFSSATYPALRDYLGAATLPDARGRYRATLNQATGRLTGTSGTGGINGNTILDAGGSQTIAQGNIPNYALTVTDPGHFHAFSNALMADNGPQAVDFGSQFSVGERLTVNTQTGSKTTGITVASGGSGNSYAPPSYIGGLTLIRAG